MILINFTCKYHEAKQYFKPGEIMHNRLCKLTNLIIIAKRELGISKENGNKSQ